MSQTLTLTGGGLRITFRRVPDRWAHRVERFTEKGAERLLESVEGAADEIWPPSPPLQDALEQKGPHGPVCLLVGMAGRSHWSLSCSLDLEAGKATFDVASRVTESPAWLGSTYRIGRDAETSGGGSGLLVVAGEAALRIDSEGAHRREADLIEIRAQLPEGPRPQTVRWRYTVTVLGDHVEGGSV